MIKPGNRNSIVIIGHQSAAISANYTHIDAETKRQAIEKMPDILEEGK